MVDLVQCPQLSGGVHPEHRIAPIVGGQEEQNDLLKNVCLDEYRFLLRYFCKKFTTNVGKPANNLNAESIRKTIVP